MALFSCGASAGLNYLFDILLLADVRKPIIISLHCLDVPLSVCVCGKWGNVGIFFLSLIFGISFRLIYVLRNYHVICTCIGKDEAMRFLKWYSWLS